MSETFENETCGTCARFSRDTGTDEMGACFDFEVRISSGRYAYGAVPASGKACEQWKRRNRAQTDARFNVASIVEEFLEAEGFDGLYCDEGCGCLVGGLMPCYCNEGVIGCEPAYRFDCARCGNADDCEKRPEGGDWVLSPSKDYCAPRIMAESEGGK